jgi:Zn-dependent protease/predicted transcriptional regulator
MQNSIRIGSLFGIAIFVHLSWFIIFALVCLAMMGHFSALFPHLPVAVLYATALLATLLFFASVVFHELAHSLLAVRRGQPVKSITLFIFGGVSSLERDADGPNTEILVALVGPLSSFVLALAFGAIWLVSRQTIPLAGAITGWLAAINAMLGLFNLLPGLPLDGGRILRGVLWRATGDSLGATRWAGAVGRLLGYALIAVGVWRLARWSDMGGGIWLALIGFFLLNAARLTVRQVEVQQSIAGLHAGDVMSVDCPTVPPGINLNEFVERLLHTGRRCFIVGEIDSPRGLITLADARAVPKTQWQHTSVQAAMRPLEKLHCVAAATDLEQVLKLMATHHISQVPVQADGKVLGLVGDEQLQHLLRNRIQLAA